MSRSRPGRLDERARRRSRGFSVIELLVVLVVMGIVLTTALPNFLDYQRRNRTETAAADLASRVRLARQKALTRRVPYRVVFDQANDQYQVERRVGPGDWIKDPDEVFSLPPDVTCVADLGGNDGNVDLELETQGTADIDDVPAFIRFEGVNDTLTVSVVRTGKVRVTRGSN